MKKGFLRLFGVVLFVVGILVSAFPAPQGSVELGKIAIPKDFELDTSTDTDILSQGEYRLSLYDGNLGLSFRNKKDGLEYGFGLPTEAEKTREDIRPPKIDVSIIKEAGVDHIRIRAFSGLKMYTSLLRCASEETPEMLSAESLASLDPQIIAESDTLKETFVLLDRYAATIWPNWTEYKGLEFSVVFPNRTKLLVTAKERMPALFKQMDIVMPGGKRVFVNRSREIAGRLGPITGWHANGGGPTVNAALTGMIAPQKQEAVNLNSPSPSPDAKAGKSAEDVSRFSRMMTYVHEAFHCMQRWRIVQAELKGLGKNPGMPNRDFVATPDFSLHSEIEGEALLKAFSETNDAKALEYFKDFLVARDLKLKGMSAGAAASDSGNTLIEGSATYSGFKMAMLVQEAGLNRKAVGGRDPISAAFARTGDYLDKEMKSDMIGLRGDTFDIWKKPYLYGAYWCLLLDRFFPSWKQGLFENNRSLHEATADFLKMTDAEKAAIARRLKTDFEYEKIMVRHARVFKDRDDAIASIANRKGKTFLVDLKHAQRGFDINPRPNSFIYRSQQIFPRGLAGFVYGSLKLKSEETPMRFVMNENLLEWIDTDARMGEKGYDLKYKSQEGDLYKDVTLTNKGFSMTAKAIKIAEDGDTVKISIWD